MSTKNPAPAKNQAQAASLYPNEPGFKPAKPVAVGGVILMNTPIEYNTGRKTVQLVVRNTGDQLDLFAAMFAAVLVAVVLIAALGLAGRLSAVARERRREMGFLRAIGFSRRFVAGALLSEVSILSLGGAVAGGVAGCALAAAAAPAIHRVMALPTVSLSLPDAVGLVALACVAAAAVCALAAVVPARGVLKDGAYGALQKGDLS